MRNSAYLVLGSILALIVSTETFAEDLTYRRYLPNQEIRCEVLDHSNRLWVGTNSGFSIINNEYIRSFDWIGTSGGEIVLSAIPYIMPYDKEALVATPDALYVFSIEDERFQELRYNDAGIQISAATTDDEGKAYFFSTIFNELLSYDFKTDEMTSIRSFKDMEQFQFQALEVVGNRIIMADNSRGIFTLGLSGEALSHEAQIPTSILSSVTTVNQSREYLWLASRNNDIYCYSIESNGFREKAVFSARGAGLSNVQIQGISARDELAYVATNGDGIFVLNLEEGSSYSIAEPAAKKITHICVAGHSNNIIAGTSYNGLIYGKKEFAETLSSTRINSDIVTNSCCIRSYLFDKDGTVWFGTDGFGLNRYDERTNVVTQINDIPVSNITSMANYGDEEILCVLEGKEFVLINKKTHEVKPFLPEATSRASERESYRYDRMVADAGDGTVLILNTEGVNYKLTPGVNMVESFVTGDKENPDIIENLVSLRHQTFFQTRHAIYELNNGTLMIRRIYYNEDENLVDITCDEENIVYIAMDDGVKKFDPRQGTIDTYIDPQSDLNPMAICCDNLGYMWVQTINNVILSINLETGRRHYYPDMETSPYAGRFAAISPSGRLYMSCAAGITTLDTKPESKPSYTGNVPSVRIESISVDGSLTELPKENRPFKIPSRYKSMACNLLVISDNPLAAVPLRISIVRGSKVIENRVTKTPRLTLPHLSPGRYAIKIAALNEKGWPEQATIMTLRIKPLFALSAWAFILYFIFVGLLFYMYRGILQRNEKDRVQKSLNTYEQQKSEEKITLMTNLAHDLRSPLSLVMNRINSTLDARPDDEYVKKTLGATLPQIRKMTNMVNMILSIQKMNATSEELNYEDVNLNQWIADMLEAEYEPKCAAKGISLVFTPDTDIQNVAIDKIKINSCVQNLMSNAIKYSEKGTITVATSIINNYIRISFCDEGCGFDCPAEELFKKFYRQNHATPGYGLGLTYVKNLVEKLGGDLWAYNNPSGVGSTFYIDIPLVNKEDASTAIIRERHIDYDCSHDTLLVADDQKDIRDYVISEFGSKFKKVYSAENGIIALQLIKDKRPDLIISDLMMPKMDGFELCKQVKSTVEISHIPFILFSTKEDALAQHISYKLGPDDSIAKPFDVKLLHDIIKAQLRGRKRVRGEFAEGKADKITKEMLISKADETFIAALHKAAENGEHTVAAVSQAIGMTPAELDRKIFAITGINAQQYLAKL